MFRKLLFLSTALVTCALVACGGGVTPQTAGSGIAVPLNAGGNNVTPTMVGSAMTSDGLALTATLPRNSVGEELPAEGVGTSDHKPWGTVGGFTQTKRAQTLAFPPGTVITIHNLSKTNEHTFNFVKMVGGPPARFPSDMNLSVNARGHGVFGPGYASGPIPPGGSVKVKLSKAGKYLIGCAFHYAEGMQDVIVVKDGAKPGPTSSPSPAPSSQPTSAPPGGGW
jgi:plastocyanin